MTKPRIACVGECMIELSQLDLDQGAARIGFAGDTLNTATYLARLGCEVSYITNLGIDAFSARMLEGFAAENIDCRLIGQHETRLPGIYSIEIDDKGERSFRYWRDMSAARTLFQGVGATFDDLAAFDVIYLSGITLAILPPLVRDVLIGRLAALKQGGKIIVFDSNYRPRLWPIEGAAKSAFDAMWAATSLALPSFDDEEKLAPGIAPQAALDRIVALGAGEVALKNGASGPLIWQGDKTINPILPEADSVVDTSGAGDSFNAGYLAARLSGADSLAAAKAGHQLATAVIGHHGAIIPKDAMPA